MELGERTDRRRRRNLVREQSYRTGEEVNRSERRQRMGVCYRDDETGTYETGAGSSSGAAGMIAVHSLMAVPSFHGGRADSEPPSKYQDYQGSPLHGYSDTIDQNNYYGRNFSPPVLPPHVSPRHSPRDYYQGDDEQANPWENPAVYPNAPYHQPMVSIFSITCICFVEVVCMT